jgi:hypothetical protein
VGLVVVKQNAPSERPAPVTDRIAAADRVLAREAALQLLAYCRACDWAGHDPYDALNSRLFQPLGLFRFKLVRLALTQALKRSPINFRPLLLVPKTQNPKGLALFVASCLKLSKLGLVEEAGNLISDLGASLAALRSRDLAYWCWGYSFPWQTRSLLVPRGAPNLVCTSFVASALLDLYDACGEERFLAMAASAADYIWKELLWTKGKSLASFSYPAPGVKSKVHNANFLGAALLCRVYAHTGQGDLVEAALAVSRYSAGCQYEDGSWDYGEAPTQRWKDNFHTGFNLCALRSLGRHARTSEFEPHLCRGVRFYLEHFFSKDGTPKYFHDRTGPMDVHSAAQSIITLLECKDLAVGSIDLARSVLNWTLANLRASQGYFYYQKRKWGRIKIPYMRWGQAWMLLALATFLEEACSGETAPQAEEAFALPEVVA